MNTNTIPLARFDSHINVVANYHSVPFCETHSDGGYAIRVLEIHRLKKMKPVIDKFETLTGYQLAQVPCTPDEIKQLVIRGDKLCHTSQENIKQQKDEFNSIEHELNNLSSGNISAARDNPAERARRLLDRKERILLELKKAENTHVFHQGLLTLLKDEISTLLKSGQNKYMFATPKKLAGGEMPESVYKSDSTYGGSTPCHYIMKELNQLNTSLMSINASCELPTDKYALNNGGRLRAEYYRDYYSPQGEQARREIPAKDYVDLMMSRHATRSSRSHMMQQAL
ncbi:TPA: hypothetical protein PXP51_003299 [Yersinia enterocolitica]|nr:hypothetical protein [Yersinia enterocolitica]